MDSLEYVDSLIKEYLLFRGFQSTLRAFESDLRSDKLTHLDADKLTLSLLGAAKSLDFPSLQDLWSSLQRHVFPSLPHADAGLAARKMESSLFRFFIVCAMQQGKPQRVTDFLATLDFAAQGSEWMHWAAIVHVKRPQSTPPFDVYFTKTWVDLFQTSLRNFLERALAAMPLPRLLNFNLDRIQRKNLELESSKLREQVEYWKSQAMATRPTSAPTNPPPSSSSSHHHPPLSISTAAAFLPSSSSSASHDPGAPGGGRTTTTAPHTPIGSALGTPTTAIPTAGGPLHPDDEPYLVLEDTMVALDDAPRARVAVSRDGTWIATDVAGAGGDAVRAWQVGKPFALSVRVAAGGGGPAGPAAGGSVAEVLWIDAGHADHAKGPLLAAVFACGWIRCVAPESKSIVADVQLPVEVSAAATIATMTGGAAVVAAGTAGVCLVSIKLSSVVIYQTLSRGHAEGDKVLHVVVVESAGGGAAAGKSLVVVSANWVHIYDLSSDATALTHTHSLPTPFPPLACFPHPPDPSFALALVSSRGAVAVLNTKSGVIDPLLQYTLPGFPNGLASARACAVMPPAPATLGRGGDADAGGAGGASGVHLVVGNLVYLIPQGRMVQDLMSSSSALGDPPMGGGLHRSNSSVSAGGSRALSRQGSVTSANNAIALAAASVAASTVTVSGGNASGTTWTPGSSNVTSPAEVSRQIGAAGGGDRVTCVGVGKNVIVQGRASGVVRVVKVMVV